MKHSRSYKNLDFFDKLDTPDKSYWFGFLFGDGAMYSGDKHAHFISLTLQQSDFTHLYKFASIFEDEPKFYMPKGTNCISYSITRKDFHDSLYDLGLRQNKSLIRATGFSESIPYEFVRDFTRGLFDADGCASNGFAITNGSLEALYFICSHAPVELPPPRKTTKIYILDCRAFLKVEKIHDWMYHNDTGPCLFRKRVAMERWLSDRRINMKRRPHRLSVAR